MTLFRRNAGIILHHIEQKDGTDYHHYMMCSYSDLTFGGWHIPGTRRINMPAILDVTDARDAAKIMTDHLKEFETSTRMTAHHKATLRAEQAALDLIYKDDLTQEFHRAQSAILKNADTRANQVLRGQIAETIWDVNPGLLFRNQNKERSENNLDMVFTMSDKKEKYDMAA